MIKKYKKFYEIDRYQIDQSLEEILAFFDIMKKFASKCHGHLKYLVYLVNNLIESDDYLELIDTTLHTKGPFKLSKNIYHSTQIEEHYGKNRQEDSPQMNLQKLYTSMQEEQDRLSQKLQDGQNQTQFIKSCMDKVFGKLDGIRNETDLRKEKINIVNNIQCPNCGMGDRKGSFTEKFLPHPIDDDQGQKYQRPPKNTKSMYEVKKPDDIFDSFDSEIDSPREKNYKQQTTPIFNNKKIKQLENEIDDLKGIINQEKKKNRNLSLENQDLIEQLRERDDEEQDKDQETQDLKENIRDLEDALQMSQQKINKLNKKLQSAKKNDIGPSANYYQPKDKAKDDLIDELKKKNHALNDQINMMEDRVKLIEEKEEQIKQPFSSDILKCLFSQVSYIDFMQPQVIYQLLSFPNLNNEQIRSNFYGEI